MLRTLTVSDKKQVIALSRLLWENDYLPDRYEERVHDPNWFFVGLFENEKLIGIIAQQRVPDTTFAWVKSLRVHPDHQRQGHGLFLVNYIIKRTTEEGCSRLLYATGSANEPSKELALKAGFEQVDSAGYFRLERPYPPHPKPSPIIRPLQIDAQRMARILEEQPSLIPNEYLPYAWNFEIKDEPGLRRMSERATFHVIMNEKGTVDCVFFNTVHERQDMKTSSHTIFCLDKSIFIDTMSRILDEIEKSEFERSAFFLGPNAKKWAPDLLVVPDAFRDRTFPLYVKELGEDI